MFNCHKVYINDRLWAIVHTEAHALHLIRSLDEAGSVYNYRIEPAFIEGVWC